MQNQHTAELISAQNSHTNATTKTWVTCVTWHACKYQGHKNSPRGTSSITNQFEQVSLTSVDPVSSVPFGGAEFSAVICDTKLGADGHGFFLSRSYTLHIWLISEDAVLSCDV